MSREITFPSAIRQKAALGVGGRSGTWGISQTTHPFIRKKSGIEKSVFFLIDVAGRKLRDLPFPIASVTASFNQSGMNHPAVRTVDSSSARRFDELPDRFVVNTVPIRERRHEVEVRWRSVMVFVFFFLFDESVAV